MGLATHRGERFQFLDGEHEDQRHVLPGLELPHYVQHSGLPDTSEIQVRERNTMHIYLKSQNILKT